MEIFIYGSFVETDKEVSNINKVYNHQMLNILTEIESGNIYFLACKFIYGSFVETDKEVAEIRYNLWTPGTTSLQFLLLMCRTCDFL